MPISFNSYGYSDAGTQLVTVISQAEHKQNEKDKEQDIRIQKNYDDNVIQQEEIDSIISGGTMPVYDFGTW